MFSTPKFYVLFHTSSEIYWT